MPAAVQKTNGGMAPDFPGAAQKGKPKKKLLNIEGNGQRKKQRFLSKRERPRPNRNDRGPNKTAGRKPKGILARKIGRS